MNAAVNGLQARLAPVRSWWAALPRREKALLGWAGALLGLVLVWMLAMQPALRTLAAAPAELDALELQWQGMQKLAAEARDLRGTTPMAPAQSQAALKAATERLGDKGRLSLQGDRAVLTLTNASSGQLRDWLSEARSGARARPVEAKLSRAPQGYSGSLIVALGAAP